MFPNHSKSFYRCKIETNHRENGYRKNRKSRHYKTQKKGILSGFVKFIDWDNHENDNKIKTKLIQDKHVYIIYNFPEYLKCSLFK